MKRSLIVLSVSFIINCFTAVAQNEYKFGIGLRGGWPTGVSAKYFMGESWALEGIGTGRHRGIGLTLLLEKHKPAFGENFRWYFGGGLHGAFYSGQYYNGPHDDLYNSDSYSYGIDGVGGLEYGFSQIPITIGVDVKPAVEINYGPYFDLGAAATVRYVF